MGTILHVNEILDHAESHHPFIAVDTGILIQILDENHAYHHTTLSFFYRLKSNTNFKFVYFLASKLEIAEYFRRYSLTEHLRNQFKNSSMVFGGKGNCDQYCRRHPKITGEILDFETLTDREIRVIRNKCFNDFLDTKQGVRKWKDHCTRAYGKNITRIGKLLSDLGIEFKGLGDKEVFPNASPEPNWPQQEMFISHYALNSTEAAMIEMATSSKKILGIMTNDPEIIEIFIAEGLMNRIKCFTFNTYLLSKNLAKSA